jgi:hypothetical protein
MAHDVFISYSKRDKSIADAVCATLERQKIRCWMAPRDILPGVDWGTAIVDAIMKSRIMVLIFSSQSNRSDQVKREAQNAVSVGLPILPFRIEDVPLSLHMKYYIGTQHWLDALTPPLEAHLQHVAETVAVLLAKINQIKSASRQVGTPGGQKTKASPEGGSPTPRPEPVGKSPLRLSPPYVLAAILVLILILSVWGLITYSGKSGNSHKIAATQEPKKMVSAGEPSKQNPLFSGKSGKRHEIAVTRKLKTTAFARTPSKPSPLSPLPAAIVASPGLGFDISIGSRTYQGMEVRVNDYTTNKQEAPTIALLANNQFIIGWDSYYQVSGSDCYGKRYSADGTPMSSEILLNPKRTTGWEFGPVFAPQADGGFFVAYAGSSASVYMQRFDGNMISVGTTDTLVASWEAWPAVSSAPNRDFVITGSLWNHYSLTGHEVYARRYNAAGTPYGSAWQVNSTPTGVASGTSAYSAVASGSDGRFTIAWHNGRSNIYAQRYNANGDTVGGEFIVNSSTGGGRLYPSLVYTSSDELLITWRWYGEGDTDGGIFARRFLADGTAAGPEWRVNEITAGSQDYPNLGISSTGEFVISWITPDGNGTDIHARLYDSLGNPVGSEFQVNQFTTGNQYTSYHGGRTGTNILGDTLLFAWQGNGPGDNAGIFLTMLKLKSDGLTGQHRHNDKVNR